MWKSEDICQHSCSGRAEIASARLDKLCIYTYRESMSPSGPDLCYALAARKKARYLSRLYDRRLSKTGLTVSQFSILSLIDAHKRLKISELADLLVMERTSLVRTLRPLQGEGLIATERSPKGRSHDVMLTASGRSRFADAKPRWKEAQRAYEQEVGLDRAVRQRNETLETNFEI